MGGVAGFWGGVFSMGSIYLLMVFAKRYEILYCTLNKVNLSFFSQKNRYSRFLSHVMS